MCSSSKLFFEKYGPATYYRYDGINAELYNKLKTFIYYEEYDKLIITYNKGCISIQNMGDGIFCYSYKDNDVDREHNLNDMYIYILKYLDIKEYIKLNRKIVLDKLKKIL